MLRTYCLQQWSGLADEALEDALYDSQALRDFVGIDPVARVPMRSISARNRCRCQIQFPNARMRRAGGHPIGQHFPVARGGRKRSTPPKLPVDCVQRVLVDAAGQPWTPRGVQANGQRSHAYCRTGSRRWSES